MQRRYVGKLRETFQRVLKVRVGAGIWLRFLRTRQIVLLNLRSQCVDLTDCGPNLLVELLAGLRRANSTGPALTAPERMRSQLPSVEPLYRLASCSMLRSW